MSNPPPTPGGKKSSGRNCLLYGCLSMVVLVMLGILTVYLVFSYAFNSVVEQFTATEPRQFEDAALPQAEMDALKQRIATFTEALKDTNATAVLTLDAADLNALLVSNSDTQAMKDTVRVRLEDNTVVCDVSIPLSDFAKLPMMSRLEGRHLNANLDLSVLLENGALFTELSGARVKDQPLPDNVVQEVQKNLPWEELKKSPEMEGFFRRVKWLRVENGELRLGTGDPGNE